MAQRVTKAQPNKRNQTSFKPGCKGGPGRTPKADMPNAGSVDIFRQDLLNDWVANNPKALLKRVREEKPVEYLKAITALAPKQADAHITRNVVINMYPQGAPANHKALDLTEDDDAVSSSSGQGDQASYQGREPKDGEPVAKSDNSSNSQPNDEAE